MFKQGSILLGPRKQNVIGSSGSAPEKRQKTSRTFYKRLGPLEHEGPFPKSLSLATCRARSLLFKCVVIHAISRARWAGVGKVSQSWRRQLLTGVSHWTAAYRRLFASVDSNATTACKQSAQPRLTDGSIQIANPTPTPSAPPTKERERERERGRDPRW